MCVIFIHFVDKYPCTVLNNLSAAVNLVELQTKAAREQHYTCTHLAFNCFQFRTDTFRNDIKFFPSSFLCFCIFRNARLLAACLFTTFLPIWTKFKEMAPQERCSRNFNLNPKNFPACSQLLDLSHQTYWFDFCLPILLFAYQFTFYCWKCWTVPQKLTIIQKAFSQITF